MLRFQFFYKINITSVQLDEYFYVVITRQGWAWLVILTCWVEKTIFVLTAPWSYILKS